MTSLALQAAPDLRFEFRDLDERLLEKIAAFLGYYPAAEDPAGALVVSNDRPPKGLDPTRTRALLREQELLVSRSGGVTWFESAFGISAWCDSDAGVAGILGDDPEDGARDYFVWRVLAGLMMELAEARGWFGLHAAGAVVDGRGLLLTGPSGVGKSTLVRRLHEAGHGVLSDDLLWIRATADGFEAVPFPRGSAHTAAPLPTVERTDLAAIVCPTLVDREESTLEPYPTAAVLSVLVDQSGFLAARAGTARRFKTMLRLAAALPGYRLLAGRRQSEIPPLLARMALAPA